MAGVNAVVWTALPTNFEQETGEPFSVERAKTYLKGLTGAEQERAMGYIRKAPEEVHTSLRRALQECGLI